MGLDSRKVGIIGCGFVGSASAFALMESGMFSEMVMIDSNRDRAEGEALDISHGLPFAGPMQIYAGDYADLRDASIIIITAGASQKPGETRLDLAKKNVGILRSIVPSIAEHNDGAIVIVVANPVDILTYATVKLGGYSDAHVIGTGTMLDTARLKYLLGQRLGVDARVVHAFILGEHGDSEIAAWSSAYVSAMPLHTFCELRGFHDHEKAAKALADEVKNSAYEIIEKKGATDFGIAMSTRRLCEAIVRDEKSILSVSSVQHGAYGISDVALSVPAVIGQNGIETIVPIALSEEELHALQKSASTLKEWLAKEL